MSNELRIPVALPKSALKQLWDGQLYGKRNSSPILLDDREFAAGSVKLDRIDAALLYGLYCGVLIFSTEPGDEPLADMEFLVELLYA